MSVNKKSYRFECAINAEVSDEGSSFSTVGGNLNAGIEALQPIR